MFYQTPYYSRECLAIILTFFQSQVNGTGLRHTKAEGASAKRGAREEGLD